MIALRTIPAAASPTYTLVLLHAFPLSSKMWDRAVVELQALRDDLEIVLVDLPGFDENSNTDPWTMESVANELRDRLLILGLDRVLVCGLSMGGYVAIEFYRQCGSMVQGLILCDTKSAADTEAQKRLRSQFAADALKRGPDAAIERLYPNFVTEETDAGTAIGIQQWMREAKGEAIANALIAMRDRRDNTELLSLMSLPVLAIVGEHDTSTTPEIMRAMAEQIANASFEIMSGVAHLSAVERPAKWAEIVSSFIDTIAQ